MEKQCIVCNKSFLKKVNVSLKDWQEKSKCCSIKCRIIYTSKKNTGNKYCINRVPWNKDKNGIHLSPNTEFKKGHTPAMKGKKNLKIQGKNHWNWKGEEVGYFGLHMWISKILGSPKKCQKCQTESRSRYEWANISGEYKRDVKDWMRLCKPCHVKYDNAMRIARKVSS